MGAELSSVRLADGARSATGDLGWPPRFETVAQGSRDRLSRHFEALDRLGYQLVTTFFIAARKRLPDLREHCRLLVWHDESTPTSEISAAHDRQKYAVLQDSRHARRGIIPRQPLEWSDALSIQLVAELTPGQSCAWPIFCLGGARR